MSMEEISEVKETILSGWITTGKKTKEFESWIAEYCRVNKAVCLNSQTACAELALILSRTRMTATPISNWQINLILTNFKNSIFDERAYIDYDVSTFVKFNLTFVLISITI